MTSPLAQGLRSHFSESDLARLASARVGIAGAGGLGSNVAAKNARTEGAVTPTPCRVGSDSR